MRHVRYFVEEEGVRDLRFGFGFGTGVLLEDAVSVAKCSLDDTRGLVEEMAKTL